VTGAGAGAKARAGFFWQAGLVAGLQAGWALRCSSDYLGLGSAVPAPPCSWAPNLCMP